MRQMGGAATQTQRQGQLVYTPADLGWVALGYSNPAPAASNVVQITGYGSWSLYVLVTAGGQSTLNIVVRDETNTIDLGAAGPPAATFQVSATITAGAYRSFTFGPAGSTVPLVADWIYFTIQAAAGQNGNVTMHLFGRAY